jgi:hypothetical protein
MRFLMFVFFLTKQLLLVQLEMFLGLLIFFYFLAVLLTFENDSMVHAHCREILNQGKFDIIKIINLYSDYNI